MTKLQAIREFANFLADEHVTIARDRCEEGNWAMDIQSSTPRLKIPKDLDYHDEADKAFRKDFTTRCPIAKGFSDITLTILHEFGHWFNRNVMNIIVYDELVRGEDDYFSNPYEVLATQWAICWLLCPTNRKIAKSFEKHYYGRGQSRLISACHFFSRRAHTHLLPQYIISRNPPQVKPFKC